MARDRSTDALTNIRNGHNPEDARRVAWGRNLKSRLGHSSSFAHLKAIEESATAALEGHRGIGYPNVIAMADEAGQLGFGDCVLSPEISTLRAVSNRKARVMSAGSGTLTVNNKQIELATKDGTIGPSVVDISKLYAQTGMFTYDPGFTSTASCESGITYIDGDEGVLLYRGYPIDQLAEHGDFLETCYLLLYGELPTAAQKADFDYRVTRHTMVHEQMMRFFQGFRRDAHPMAIMVGCVGALSAFYHDSTDISDPYQRMVASMRMIAKMPTLAAMAYKYSSGANPFACIAAGIACLWGPAHGGANEAALKMLQEIGTPDKIPMYVAKAKDKNDPFRLMGFGHRVYKNYDPRAKIMQKTAHEVLNELGIKDDPLLDVAVELEQLALKDDYFIEKKLYPNIDFYSGITLKAMGFPTDMFTVLFALARTVGWIAQWKEMIEDPSQKIGRPRQLYTGATRRDYLTIAQRA